MRWGRAIRTLAVFVLLGMVATVLSSWAIHGAHSWRVQSIASPPQSFVPGVTWPFDPDRAQRIDIDTTISPGEIGVDLQGSIWVELRKSRAAGAPYLSEAHGVTADAVWRRHHRPRDRLSPLPAYPFPYLAFEGWESGVGWRVLVSEVDLWNDAFDPEHGRITETLIVVRPGWPIASMEVGAHYAQVVERHPPHPTMRVRYRGYKRVEEVHHPPAVARSSGIELWAAPRPPVAAAPAFPIRYAVTDRFALPLLPLWPGFAINTGFYALLLFIAWRTPSVVRRTLRRRCGRCARCGYDRGGLGPGTACPECGQGAGAGVATRPAAAT
ncbi:MAG: hypothetical protein RIE77_11250 [Phycisphaerales bacterium]|jgi:hypothetical protein